MLKQIAIILLCLLLGNVIKLILGVAVPGSVFGMIILFFLLKWNIIKKKDISDFSDFLLENMAFFFVPAGVGIVLYMDLIQKEIIPIIGASFLSTIVVLVVVGLVSGGRKL